MKKISHKRVKQFNSILQRKSQEIRKETKKRTPSQTFIQKNLKSDLPEKTLTSEQIQVYQSMIENISLEARILEQHNSPLQVIISKQKIKDIKNFISTCNR